VLIPRSDGWRRAAKEGAPFSVRSTLQQRRAAAPFTSADRLSKDFLDEFYRIGFWDEFWDDGYE
jgi:hypothetical protein